MRHLPQGATSLLIGKRAETALDQAIGKENIASKWSGLVGWALHRDEPHKGPLLAEPV